MNAATAKQQFSSIQMSALPSDIQEELKRFKQESRNFSTGIPEEKEIYGNWMELYDIIQSAFPGAISKPAKTMSTAKKPSVKMPTKTAKVKTVKVKAEKMPKVNKREEAQKEKLQKIKMQVESYKKQLKASDSVKAQIAKLAQQEYNKISQLGSTKLEADIQKAEIQRKLYKRFLVSDKAKFKSISEKTAGKTSLGKPKQKAKAKTKVKPKAKPASKAKTKTLFERIFN